MDNPFTNGFLSNLSYQILRKPEVFAFPSQTSKEVNELLQKLRLALKQLYSFEAQVRRSRKGFQKLNVDGFDSEQIWEQMSERHAAQLNYLTNLSNHFTKPSVEALVLETLKDKGRATKKQRLSSSSQAESLLSDTIKERESDSDSDSDRDGNESKVSGEESDATTSSSEAHTPKPKSRRSKNRLPGEDEFFTYEAMEAFIEEAENQKDGADDSDEEIDLFMDYEEDGDVHYKDFFDEIDEGESTDESEAEGSPDDDVGAMSDEEFDATKYDMDEEGEEEQDMEAKEEGEMGESKLSSYERKQLEMKKMIAELEDGLVAPKRWQHSGEVSAKERPRSALLEEELDFQHASRPKPVITESTTLTLEDIIKRRIKEESWDDVVRLVKPKEKTEKKVLELDHEKSSLGLAEVYEQKFMKDVEGVDKQAELVNKKHAEIKKLYAELAQSLDALSNFNFTPKIKHDVIVAIPKVPAISLEEAIPISISKDQAQAPEDVFKPSKRAIKGQSEVTKAERKSKRRAHKQANKRKDALQKQHGIKKKVTRKEAIKKLQQSKNVTVVGTSGKSKAHKSSKVFFNELQNAQYQEPKKEHKRSTKQANKYKL